METNSDTPINSRVTPVSASIDEITKTTKETLNPLGQVYLRMMNMTSIRC